MNCLIDTHAFLWAVFSPELLSPNASSLIRDPANSVHLSVISIWEISLKFSLGKLELTGVLPDELPDAARQMGLDILPLQEAEAASFHRLPRLEHKDPFDRLLIWQAVSRKLTIVSADKGFLAYRRYGLKHVW